MIHKIVQYKVNREALAEVEQAIREFVEILYPNCEIQPKFDDLVIFKSTSSIEQR